jgi:hypothetical protein
LYTHTRKDHMSVLKKLLGKGKAPALAPAPPVKPGVAYPRQCPNSNHYVPAGIEYCPHCGYKMPPPGQTLAHLH